jgi:hypothetical protein
MGMLVNLYPRRRGRDEQLPTPIMEMVRLIAAPVVVGVSTDHQIRDRPTQNPAGSVRRWP